MNTEDFNFLLKKEILILFFLLLALTFAQVSVGQLTGIRRIEPFLALNISFFETLGMILPIFAIIFIYFQKRSEKEMSLRPFILFLGVAVVAVIFIVSLGASIIPEEESPVSPDTNTTVTPIMQQTIEPQSQSPSPPDDGYKSLDLGFFFQFLMESKIFLAITILFLPILLIMIIRGKSRPEETDLEITSDIPADRQEKPYRMRTILECYYQASTALEERGADSSPSFTPTEFTTDVAAKNLTSTLLINNLTSLYEEVKFSTHDISDQQVNSAKSLSSKIVFSSDSPVKNETEKEPEEIE